ncbi:MAG: uncharacterized protein QG559_1710 [Campylobacterota bacterium]|nr:uncharacterized protein [Campylobacterota bacterium]
MVDPIVLRLAKSAILSEFGNVYSFDRELLLKEYPFLSKEGACFVTLKYDDSLRGCIGSIVAHTRLLDDILHNAISAAFSDPRFTPLREDEFSHLHLEVSILSTPEAIEYDDYEDLLAKIEPKKDGLILKYGSYQGTFLPQVWEQLPSVELFLEHLSYKAGANPSVYMHHPTIYRYRVEAVEENFNEVLPL